MDLMFEHHSEDVDAPTSYYGRHRFGKMCGITVMASSNRLWLWPINSRGRSNAAMLQIPAGYVNDVIAAMHHEQGYAMIRGCALNRDDMASYYRQVEGLEYNEAEEKAEALTDADMEDIAAWFASALFEEENHFMDLLDRAVELREHYREVEK